MNYDIAVVGNDEAAFEILHLATGCGLRAIAVLPESRHSSWIVVQALRRLVTDLLVHQSADRRQLFARIGTPSLLRRCVRRVIADEIADQARFLQRDGVDVILGDAQFTSEKKLAVAQQTHRCQRQVLADAVTIATGVRYTALQGRLGLVPMHGPAMMFEGRVLPRSLCLIAGTTFGAGLAALFSLFGVRVTHVARRDEESVMLELATLAGVRLVYRPADAGLSSTGLLPSGEYERVIDCRRTIGLAEHLNLNVVGVEPDENGQLWCAANFETWCAGVYGIGDVVGFAPESGLSARDQAWRVLQHAVAGVRRPRQSPIQRGGSSASVSAAPNSPINGTNTNPPRFSV